MKQQKGFGLVQILLVIVIIGLLGGTGWYVVQARKNTDQTLQNTAKSQNDPQKAETKKPESKPAVDPIADWVSYTNKSGVYSLKHPKSWATASMPNLCAEGLVLLGGNSSSVGTCASENGGQMGVSSAEGDQRSSYGLNSADFNDIKKTEAIVDGVKGERVEGITKGLSEDALGGYKAGTKVIHYLFYAKNGRTYVATYVQKAEYPNVLTDFELMVTSTLKFSI